MSESATPPSYAPVQPGSASDVPLDVLAAMREPGETLWALKSALEVRLSGPEAIGEACLHVASVLLHSRSALLGEGIPSFTPTSLREIPAESVGLSATTENDAWMAVFVRYDRYFGVTRLPATEVRLRYAEAARVFADVLVDIRNVSMDSYELVCIAAAMANYLSPVSGAVLDATLPQERRADHDRIAHPKVHVGGVEQEALYRWKLGHHLFNAFTLASAERLEATLEATTSDRIATLLYEAAVLLRGTTSAMWYAESFPPKLYESHIRPTMVEASGTGSGFSGTDNLEFRYFKAAFSNAMSSLSNTYGEPGDWPDDVWKAAYFLADTRVVDLEHHTLLAEKVVGRRASLKQERVQSGVATAHAMIELPAVEGLRELASKARAFRESLGA